MFSVLSLRMEDKQAIEIEHQCSFKIFVNFWAFLLLPSPISHIFTIFSGVQKYVLKHVIQLFGLFKKKHFFFLRDFYKRTNCPPIVTLALLLFVACEMMPPAETAARWHSVLLIKTQHHITIVSFVSALFFVFFQEALKHL